MQDAVLYARAKNVQIAIQVQILHEFGSLIRWDKSREIRLLDIGCGDGDILVDLFLATVPSNRESVLGVDILPDMVRIAREKHGSVPDVSFAVLDIESKCENEIAKLGVFSHVTSFLCLHWIKDQRQAFANIHKLLQPGGQLFATIVRKYPMGDVYRELADDPRWEPYMHDWTEYAWQHADESHAVLCKAIETASFAWYQLESCKSKFHFKSEQEMKESFQAVNSFVTRMPPPLRNAYMDHVVEVYRKQTGVNDEIEIDIFVLYAVK